MYHAKGDKSDPDQRKTFVAKTLKKLIGLRIKFVEIAGDTPIVFGNTQIQVPNMLHEPIVLSIQTALRTLDLMHVAAARHAKQENAEMGAFVTGDRELLLMKDQLSKIAGMPIVSPREYVKSLGLR